MEANELMLNDWVQTSGKYAQVLDIDYNYACLDISKCEFHIRYLEPILLTKEILIVNGFDGHYLWLKEGETNGDTEYVEMELTQESSMFFFIRRTYNKGQFKGVLKYVHELQHALRLCGLNELADNFKLR